jgi:hypothetical protein
MCPYLQPDIIASIDQSITINQLRSVLPGLLAGFPSLQREIGLQWINK